MAKGKIFDTFFNEALRKQLEKIGEVTWNESTDQFTHEELCEKIKDIDLCVTGWGTPVFDEEVVACANKLKLIAHTGGSVKPYVTESVYDRGIRVISGNDIFAESVAEGVIAYALTSLRDIPRFSSELKQGIWPSEFYNKGLLNKTVGIVGYGMIARMVIELLKPFKVKIKVFSRHIQQEELQKHGMTQCTLEEIFETCDIVSLHSGMTKENYHLITEELLTSMKEGALFINTARGAIVDEQALVRVLKTGKINAVLDVYEVEPLPKDSPLLEIPTVILMPHMGGPTIDRRFVVTESVIGDIKRFLENQPMHCEISRAYARKMSEH